MEDSLAIYAKSLYKESEQNANEKKFEKAYYLIVQAYSVKGVVNGYKQYVIALKSWLIAFIKSKTPKEIIMEQRRTLDAMRKSLDNFYYKYMRFKD